MEGENDDALPSFSTYALLMLWKYFYSHNGYDAFGGKKDDDLGTYGCPIFKNLKKELFYTFLI